jgi:glycosyltransferase involved in cell wall biosynthesis
LEKLPITVIILTFNEEKNIKPCLDSIFPYVSQVLVLDSGSTDSTLSIVSSYQTIEVYNHPFENYAKQRNWAFENLPIKNDWILNMDADHRATPELVEELIDWFHSDKIQDVNGFLISRRTIFMNKWIKRGGHYPTYHAILFRKGKGACEVKNYDQHFVIEGNIKILKSDMIDIITDSLSNFIDRHNRWSSLEAEEVVSEFVLVGNFVKPDKFGNPMEKRRYLKYKYYSYPIFLRVFIYFFIRYFIRLGVLDGIQGLIFHFLQGFWFRLLVDAKIYELLNSKNENKS